jgi:pimeloyl-ACP methyl ester carboxylesterase
MEGSGEFFKPLINALGTSVNTQVISYPQNKALNYLQLTEFVKNLLPKNLPYIVLGESFSGPIAINIAAEKPPNLQALILVGTFVRSPVPIPKIFRKLVCLLPASWIPLTVIARYLLGDYATPNLLAQLNEILPSIPDNVYRGRLLSILNVNVSQALSDINVPILYIRATQDKIVPETSRELIVSIQPNTKIADIEGPHFILQTQPETSSALILRFLLALKMP